MAMVKHGHPLYLQQQQQRGGSLDRGQGLDQHQDLQHQDLQQSSRHRRPMPLPLAARHQVFLLENLIILKQAKKHCVTFSLDISLGSASAWSAVQTPARDN